MSLREFVYPDGPEEDARDGLMDDLVDVAVSRAHPPMESLVEYTENNYPTGGYPAEPRPTDEFIEFMFNEERGWRADLMTDGVWAVVDKLIQLHEKWESERD